MIKKLKRRFMLVIMMIFTVLILGLAVGIFTLMVSSEERESISVMEFALKDISVSRGGEKAPQEDFPEDTFFRRIDRDDDKDEYRNRMQRSWITVEYDINGNVISLFRSMNRQAYSDAEDNTDSDNIISEAAKSLDGGGKTAIGDVQYRYLTKGGGENEPYFKKVVLLDSSAETATLQRLAVIVGVIALAGIGAVFILSIFLAKWAVRPIEEAWNKQKEFIANASHELKTPLTVISANTDVILSNPQETVGSQEKWFGYIKEETAKMSGLVTSMLNLAREDRDDDDTVMTEFCISDVIEGACLSFEAQVYECGRTMETDIEPQVDIRGDKEKIARLAHILIDNAVSHSKEGGYIKVSLRRRKNKVRFSVENNGEQIPKEDIPRLFERYYRADKSHNSSGGFGLGLAIAKMIVMKHNGNIGVTSTPEGITTFTVTI
ncbi:MAG: sensor histidine kinase [Oscillospiraceae bacterium]